MRSSAGLTMVPRIIKNWLKIGSMAGIKYWNWQSNRLSIPIRQQQAAAMRSFFMDTAFGLCAHASNCSKAYLTKGISKALLYSLVGMLIKNKCAGFSVYVFFFGEDNPVAFITAPLPNWSLMLSTALNSCNFSTDLSNKFI